MLTFRALQSGSAGNAFLVETDEITLLLDAGLTVRRLEGYLAALRIGPERLGGIVLTHEHFDHAAGAAAIARKLGLPIYATNGTLARLDLDDCDAVPFKPHQPLRLSDVELTPFPVQHDAAEPIGLLVEHAGARVALATDLGTVDEGTFEFLCQADLVVLESNHDWDRLWRGPYPMPLKRRIASDRGHLSNEQAASCLARCAEEGRMRWGWLAHLSETNNSQRCALGAVSARLGAGPSRIGCLRRRAPSLTWRSTDVYVQTRLF
jgi:phosphoribosyl 1,2-cyclic phosphodiesterase